MKKIFGAILILMLLLSGLALAEDDGLASLPSQLQAAEFLNEQLALLYDAPLMTVELPDGKLTFCITGSTCCLTEADQTITHAEIPAEVNGRPVTVIGEKAFYGHDALVSVSIPESVTEIRLEAFSRCPGLTEIDLPEGLKHIHSGVFYGCTSLAEVELPPTLNGIDYEAFSGCTSLASIVIPESVKQIRDNAFDKCENLTLIVSKGSYAEAFCIKNYLAYTYGEQD